MRSAKQRKPHTRRRRSYEKLVRMQRFKHQSKRPMETKSEPVRQPANREPGVQLLVILLILLPLMMLFLLPGGGGMLHGGMFFWMGLLLCFWLISMLCGTRVDSAPVTTGIRFRSRTT